MIKYGEKTYFLSSLSVLRNNRTLSIDTTESEYSRDKCTVEIESPVNKMRMTSAKPKKRTH